MRAAECFVQQSLEDSFRYHMHPIRREDLRHLTQTMFDKDPSWLNALYVTPGNLIRNDINTDCMQRLAHNRGVPVIRWKLELCRCMHPPTKIPKVYLTIFLASVKTPCHTLFQLLQHTQTSI